MVHSSHNDHFQGDSSLSSSRLDNTTQSSLHLTAAPPTVTSAVHCFYLSPFVSDVLSLWWDWTATCWDVWWNLLWSPPQLSDVAMTRLSIFLLTCHSMDALGILNLSPPTTVAPEWHFPNFGWLVGCILLFSTSLLVTSVWFLPPEDALMATALVSLFCLEAMLPLVVMGCTSLWLVQQLSWLTSLVLLGIVWATIAVLAHCLRCALYQNVGHE